MEAWLPVFANIMKPFIGVSNPYAAIAFLILLGAIFFYFVYKTQGFQKLFYISSLTLIIITIVGFSLYGKRPSEYYFTYFIPFIYIALSDFLIILNRKLITGIVIGLLILINSNDLKNITKREALNLYDKDAAVQKILPFAQDKRVNVSYDMPLGLNNGYDYSVDYYKINRTGDPKEDDIVVEGIGVHIPPELK